MPGGVYLYRVVQMQAYFYIICYFETDRKINFQSVSYHCEVAWRLNNVMKYCKIISIVSAVMPTRWICWREVSAEMKHLSLRKKNRETVFVVENAYQPKDTLCKIIILQLICFLERYKIQKGTITSIFVKRKTNTVCRGVARI